MSNNTIDYDRLGEIVAKRLLPKIIPDLAVELRSTMTELLLTNAEFLAAVKGPKGDPGESGPSGVDGLTGPPGPQGELGPSGPGGPSGKLGKQGDTGPIGSQGLAGSPGEQGPAGRNGCSVDDVLTADGFTTSIAEKVKLALQDNWRDRDERTQKAATSLGPLLVEVFRHGRQTIHDKVARAKKAKGDDQAVTKVLKDHARLLRNKLDYAIEPVSRSTWYMRTIDKYDMIVMQGLGPHIDGMVQRHIVALTEEIATNGNARLDPGDCVEEITLLVRAIMGQIDQLGGKHAYS